uniref:TetR/AcrR family transcriptional regulator n=1 Tax=Streptomyces sp. NBC_00093 TaxID=2975649 RepID=A0AAU2ABT3_9ACTN
MDEEQVSRRPGGRSARVRRAVLDATLAVVADQGLDKFRVGDVAARAGVHETSVYRRWGTRQRLLVDALFHHSEAQMRIPDTGSLRTDLVAFTHSLIGYLSSPLGAAFMRVMAVVNDDAMPDSRAELWRSRVDLARTMIDRAAARGEVREGTDARLVLEQLIAPLHFRVLLLREPLDEDLAEQLVDSLLRGIAR